MRLAQDGMKSAVRLYATISSGKEIKGKPLLTLEHVWRYCSLWQHSQRR